MSMFVVVEGETGALGPVQKHGGLRLLFKIAPRYRALREPGKMLRRIGCPEAGIVIGAGFNNPQRVEPEGECDPLLRSPIGRT